MNTLRSFLFFVETPRHRKGAAHYLYRAILPPTLVRVEAKLQGKLGATSPALGRVVMVVSLPRLLAALVAAVAMGGCSRPTQPPSSAFFSAIDGVKLKAIADQCAPEAVKKWGMHGSGQGSTDKYFSGDFQCEPETLQEFLQALKVELQKAVDMHGGRVTSSVSLSQDETRRAFAKIGARREPPAAALTGVQLDYEVGAARGEILVTVSQLESRAHYEYPLWLHVCVIEPVPAVQRPAVEPKPSSGR